MNFMTFPHELWLMVSYLIDHRDHSTSVPAPPQSRYPFCDEKIMSLFTMAHKRHTINQSGQTLKFSRKTIAGLIGQSIDRNFVVCSARVSIALSILVIWILNFRIEINFTENKWNKNNNNVPHLTAHALLSPSTTAATHIRISRCFPNHFCCSISLSLSLRWVRGGSAHGLMHTFIKNIFSKFAFWINYSEFWFCFHILWKYVQIRNTNS